MWIGLALTIVLSLVTSVVANQLDAPIGRALDRLSDPIRKWRQRRAKKIDTVVEALSQDNKRLIAFCAYRTTSLMFYLILGIALSLASILFSHWLHDISQIHNSHPAKIAWTCITSASCRKDQYRLFSDSIAYFGLTLGELVSFYIFFYEDFRFKYILKRVTKLGGSQLGS